MALKFMEGWELYYGSGSPPTAFTSKWGTVNKNYLLDLTTGANFGFGMRFGKSSTGTADYAQTPTLDAQNTWIVGFNLKRDTAGRNGRFFRVYNENILQLEFRLSNTDIQVYRSDSILIHTFSNVLSDTGTDTWHHLQFKFTISTTVGSVECRYNNFNAGTGGIDLNTDAANSGLADSFMLTATQSANQTSDFTIDDFWICDTSGSRNNDWLGIMSIEGVYPDGVGYQSDWSTNITDTNPSIYADFFTYARLNTSDDSFSSQFTKNYSSVNYIAGPNGLNYHYVTIFSFINFGQKYNVYDTAENFILSYYNLTNLVESLDVRIAAGKISEPNSGDDISTMWKNPLSSKITINPSNSPSTLNISSLITEWFNQSGWDNSWDLHIMFGRTPGDIGANYFIFNISPENRKLNFNVTGNSISSIVNSSENDYIQSNQIGDIQAYTVSEPNHILGNVRGVAINWSGRKGGATDTVPLKSFIRSGSTNGYGTSKNIQLPYPPKSFIDIHELNPESGGVPWSRQYLSNIEIGIKFEE